MPWPRSCAARRPSIVPSGNPDARPEPGLILPPAAADPAEAWLVLPGLNLHPQRLEPAAAWCTATGGAVVQPRLRGYAEAGDPAQGRVRAADWLADLDHAWSRARTRFPSAAPALLGYSLGALLGLVWSLSRGVALRRALLLSPALRLKRAHRLVLGSVGRLLPGRVRLPSLSPEAYRMHPATSIAAYRALAALERHLAPHLARWLAGDAEGLPPLLVACSLRDELIDTRPLLALARAQPGAVTLVPLSHSPRRGYPHHLGLDANTLGEAEWRRLSAACMDWLRGPAGPGEAAGTPPDEPPGAR